VHDKFNLGVKSRLAMIVSSISTRTGCIVRASSRSWDQTGCDVFNQLGLCSECVFNQTGMTLGSERLPSADMVV
jgi:hypothetical protein